MGEGLGVREARSGVRDARLGVGGADLGMRLARILPLFLTLALAAVVVLLNPNGTRMYSYPFETLTSAAMQRYIQEWFSPDLHQIEWLPFGLLLFATLGTALAARARVPLPDILLVVILGLAALRSARNVPLFALVAIPVLAAQLNALVPLRPGARAPSRRAALVNILILVIIGLVALVRIANGLAGQGEVERARFPAAAVEWIQQNRPAPNLYNSYGWGGYLIWELYPDYRVYIDGRADVHGDAFIEEFLEVYRGEPGWQEELGRREVRLVLVEPDAPLAAALASGGGWREVFRDSQSVVFQRE